MKYILIAGVAGLCAAGGALAADITVLSAGAVEPGLHAFAAQVKRDLGHELKIIFNTTPQITKRLAAGEVYDILILPPAPLEQAVKDGKAVAATRVPVGRVGAASADAAKAVLRQLATPAGKAAFVSAGIE